MERNVSLDEAARAFHKVCGWGPLRWHVITRGWLGTDLTPEIAVWMDEGSFARHLLSRQPPVTALLADITPLVSGSVARRIRRALRSWDVLPMEAGRPRTGDAAWR